VLLVVQWLLWWVIPTLSPDLGLVGAIGGLGAGVLILGWWLFFSRAPWADRLGALVVMVLAYFAVLPFVHESISGAFMGHMMQIYPVPPFCAALVLVTVLANGRSQRQRRALTTAAIFVAAFAFTLLRTDGVLGISSQIHWRWTPTAEDRLLASTASEKDPTPPVVPAPAAVETPTVPHPAAPPAETAKSAPAPAPEVVVHSEWPGFRGRNRDAVVRGTHIDPDWVKSAPAEIWHKPIGPGWSSFAVQGNLIFTQEQRGEDEIVSCYDLRTGATVWRHRDRARFYESNGGAGPRATPTLHNGRVYALGATGILNALDARTGAVAWSRNALDETKAKLPGWGLAASPLIVGDDVIVATSGTLAAFDRGTGAPKWVGPKRASGYSSPQLMTIGGVQQVVHMNGYGVTSVDPATGKLLWEHKLPDAARIIQPSQTSDGDLLVSFGEYGSGNGFRRLTVTKNGGQWTVLEKWTTTSLKPDFNDFVVHKGHAYGYDGSILACVDLENGQRKWKGGRYGKGQLILLADQDLLLVVSEEGELALVNASPDQFTEVARVAALEGKTWNHPVLIGDTLLIRNGEEMAAFRLR
jgi:outer membrane protein assembly factor BamB